MFKYVFTGITFFSLTLLHAIPVEFNLREDDRGEDLYLYKERSSPTNERDSSRLNQEMAPPFSKEAPKVVPDEPDAMMLHPTELHITPQRPKLFPARPRKPEGTPPPPVPMFQKDRQSSSPY